MGRGTAAVVAGIAVLGAAAGFLLLRAKEEKARVLEPASFASPDLFPPDTVLFASLHDTEADFAEMESLWRKIEPTAAWALLSGGPDAGPGGGPAASLVRAWEETGASIGDRLGRRPDAAEFFRTFGRDATLGFVPSAAGGTPQGLLVARLPGEEEVARLRERFGSRPGMKPRQPTPSHGYPVFLEEFEGRGTLHYGVGGGHLFLAEDPTVLDGALDRLKVLVAATADSPRPPSLASEKAFAAGVPGPWPEVRFALFARRGAKVGARLEELAPGAEGSGGEMDALLARAFVPVPGEGPMALSASGPPGERRWSASFGDFSSMGRAWEQRLPAGLCLAWIPRPAAPGAREKAFGADFEALRAKRLWKEIDALARDGPRLRRLLEEAGGPGTAPPEEILARIPKDLALLGEMGESLLRSMTVGGEAPLALGQKAFGKEKVATETVLAFDLDPLSSVLLAALMETGVQETGGEAPVSWRRDPGEGPPAWHLDLGGLFGRGGPGGDPSEEAFAGMMEAWEPGVVLGNGTLYVTFGPAMRRECRDLAAGRAAPLSADPIFVRAAAAAEPGASEILYDRPGIVLRAAVASVRRPMELAADSEGMDPKARDVLRALMDAMGEASGWADAATFRVTSTLVEAERRSVTVESFDAAAAAAPPVIELGPGPIRSPAALPGSTLLLLAGRWDLGPASEAFAASFLKALPGGKERWRSLFTQESGVDPADVERPLELLVAGMKGEMGFAVVTPENPPAPEGPPTAAAALERLPSFVSFSGYRDAGASFEEAVRLLGKMVEALDTGSFEDDAAAFEAGEGPPAFGFALEREETPAGPSAAVRVTAAVEPGAPYVVHRLGVLRRGETLWFTLSPRKPAEVAGLAGGPGTLEARMKGALPASMHPADASMLLVFREDGVADGLGALLDLLVPVGPSLTLMGLEEPPSPERMKAHEEGWRQGVDLVKDAMRTSGWQVMARTREGDRWITVRRRAVVR
ncbi:MAG: hypothetical protein L6R43_06690 [Planctomycetes bacterium]|nr:hypothetical protein [Planctomycetota bacterium]